MWGYLAATAVSALLSYYQGEKQAKAQEAAQKQAEKQASEAAFASDQAFNRANQKKPSLAGLFGANEAAAKGGIGGTMLTGPQGIDKNSLLLGKSSLLGS